MKFIILRKAYLFLMFVFPFWFLIFNISIAAPLDNIPTQSYIYEAVDYLKTAGYLKAIPPTSKPSTHQDIANLLTELNLNNKQLNNQTQFYLNQLCSEFNIPLSVNLKSQPKQRLISLNYGYGKMYINPTFTFNHNNFSHHLNPIGNYVYLNNQIGTIGLNFYLDSLSKISFFNRTEINFGINKFRDTIDPAGHHLPYSRVKAYKDYLCFETKQAYLSFPFYFLTLQIGRDYLSLGPTYRGSILLSDITPALDHMQLRLQKNNYKALWFVASLSPWYDFHRFLSGQRLEIDILKNLRIGASMLVVYSFDSLQTRGFFGYLNPLIPIYLEKSNTGDEDNILFGIDFVTYLKKLKLYGHLMLDNYEFNRRPDQPPHYRPPNCYALTVGNYLPFANFSLRIEYSKITRYTYYHRIYHIAYTHYSVPLGHPLGPDADEMWLRFDYYLTNNLQISLIGTKTRCGDGNRGDLDNLTWDADEQPIREFPSGNIETTITYGPTFDYYLLNNLIIRGGVFYNNLKEIKTLINFQYRY
ncbi:MAG: capsule assembly Wzi family protein [candidate division WOR-3 bacterium]